MATILSTWEQSAQYDPLNPNQKTYVYYTGVPGGYGSFYYNRAPTTATLSGALGAALPDWATASIVGLVGVAVGFLGWKYAGPPIRRKLGLSGHRRNRRKAAPKSQRENGRRRR